MEEQTYENADRQRDQPNPDHVWFHDLIPFPQPINREIPPGIFSEESAFFRL
jgi:hypothetical protein